MRNAVRHFCSASCRMAFLAVFICTGCNHTASPSSTVTVLIESSPASLDPRIGTDAQSERIDELIFDSLVKKDAHFELQPDLAVRWETPNPTTYIFHLRPGVVFQNGQPLTARDVQWTLNSLIHHAVLSPKYQAFRNVSRVDAPDPATVILHLSQPDASLLWSLSDGALGIVPFGSGTDFQRHPIGTGPFRFVSQQIDKDVILEPNPSSWRGVPKIQRLRFAVVPDGTTRALELRKGSADLEQNALTPDMVWSLRRDPSLAVAEVPGTVVQYLTFNLHDPYLRDQRVRQAIACAINRKEIIGTLLRGQARPADSLLPPGHWAYAPPDTPTAYDPAHANALLDAAGLVRNRNGIRFHVEMKTSTDEGTRLLALVLQQQLRAVGIALDVRSYEFATFYSDITHGSFGLYSLRWIGGNEDPDIFRYAFASSSLPPHGANRGSYINPRLDALLIDAAQATDRTQRRRDYVQAQQILAHDLPAIPLWYLDSVSVYNRRLTGVQASPSGNFYSLETASLRPAQ
jgi:peptide/nickel transport system substrate-binding protein